MYSLPFNPNDKVLEVGGGDRPQFRPNLDVRPMPTVDIVADLNQPWPVAAEIYNGVFGMYIIEHVSWRRTRHFISESHRVLRPGGITVQITANLLEQARQLVETAEWNDDLVCQIFGDNDYPENTHRSGFSPGYAIKLFREAGFHEVTIFEHPACKTDMIIQATKSGVRIER